ncbi:MAG: metallophosphoesterase [Proteobacteria bacterium]|nr:metallophosphoesterase [Pseudomonadota bacterium]MBU1450725.1 metallophosphoesterase [Pseudomonadota bacterium]MBU2468664.1 metallophosphoesterase [Pseudomonadota bacterium]MBU2518188.1 metallophosphoesterase [Pseudomonadota bacterium]
MRLIRRLPARLLLGLLLVVLAAAPSLALTVQGRVVDAQGRPLAGAYLSDGVGIVATGPDGAFGLESQNGRVVALTAPPGHSAGLRWWWPAAEAARVGVFRLGAAPPQTPDRLRLVVVSDPHLYDAEAAPAWSGKLDPAVPMREWQRAAANMAAFGPSLVLALGDLAMDADHGGPEHARAQMALAARAAAMLPAPWRATPGNHDVRYTGGRVDSSLWREFLGPRRSLTFLGPVAVVLLDNPGLSTRPDGKPRTCGVLPDEALAWLKALLAMLPQDTPLLVGSHYPLASPLVGISPLRQGSLVRGPGPTGLALRDADQNAVQAMTLLAARPLVALVSGHLHAYNRSVLKGRATLRLWGAPALCGRWWQGDMDYGPLSFPPAYLRGELVRGAQGWSLDMGQVAVTPPEPSKP